MPTDTIIKRDRKGRSSCCEEFDWAVKETSYVLRLCSAKRG